MALGIAAGLADAFVAVATAAFSHAITDGAALTSWPIYVLVFGGLASLVVTQTAYQADQPLVTLPLIATVMPAMTVITGILVLSEDPHLDCTTSVAAFGAVSMVIAGLAVLSRSTSSMPARRADGRDAADEQPSRLVGAAAR